MSIMRAMPVTCDRVDLTWEAVPGAAEYRLFRAQAPASATACDRQWVAATREVPPVAKPPAAACYGVRHADRELLPERNYRYLLQALDGSGAVLRTFRANAATPAAGLRCRREGARLTIAGDAFELIWDMDQGGEIVEVRQYDGNSWLRINAEDPPTVPGLVVRDRQGRAFPLRGRKAAGLILEKVTADEVRFALHVSVPGLKIRFLYSLFREGVLFCELVMPDREVAGGRTQGVNSEPAKRLLDRYSFELGLHLHPAVLSGKLLWGYAPREYGGTLAALRRTDRVTDGRRMLPMGLVDFGVAPQGGPFDIALRQAQGHEQGRMAQGRPEGTRTGGFTNHVEFFIEDSPAAGAFSRFGDDRAGGFAFQYGFTGRSLRELYFLPWDMGSFHTRWGMCLGASRKGACERVPPLRRNMLAGARIFHTGPSQGVSAQMREHWPFNVPPVNLIHREYQGLPSEAQVRRAKAQGASVIVVHQGWMQCGGSNCDPPADYIPRDPAGLRRFIAACHRHGIRVGLYMRGVEKHALFQNYFQRFCTRDFDGFYVDWSTPLAFGYQGCSDLHFSALSCFLYTRALRERVGPKGFLIAHSGSGPTLLAFANFDAYLPGEYKTQKKGFFLSPDHALHHGFAACVGTNPIYGGRFSSPECAALSAGMGFQPHVGMRCTAGPDPRHPMTGLWRLVASVPVERAVVYNSMTENFRAIAPSRRQIYSTLYKVSRDQVLVIAANLGRRTAATLTLNMAGLGLTGRYRVTELTVPEDGRLRRRALGVTDDGVIDVTPLDRHEFRGYRLERS